MTRRTTPRTVRRRTALAVAGASMALVLAGCGGEETGNEAAVNDDGSVDLEQVTLIVGDQKSSSQQAMLEAAGEDDTPYDIQWEEFTSGPPMMEALGTGAIHLGYVGNTPPIFAAASGSELKVVQATTYTGLGDSILVPKDSDLQSVEDLAGKTVAVAEGSSANYNLLAQLREAGVDLEEVEQRNLQPADGLAAFSQGFIDAWVVWEPYVSQAVIEEDARVLADGEDVVNGMNFQVASDVALDDAATEAAVEDYVQRITRAQVWASDNQQEWSEVWAEQTGLSPDVTLAAAKKRPLTVLPVDGEVVDSEQEISDTFTDADLLPEAVDVADYFDGRYDEQLAPLVEETADNAR
ncbi:ABC transporter substrate-binding protein [uncultured Nocardioides sp.]|uniref:ABC transporter substrate-binding protein n=1 Tax=uncultured Nocardioides sp. TaxID=198441 RepID=UPI00260D9B71|nr:ABC transporter substrate-binding protein [uncultured Nocardioides sp.]